MNENVHASHYDSPEHPPDLSRLPIIINREFPLEIVKKIKFDEKSVHIFFRFFGEWQQPLSSFESIKRSRISTKDVLFGDFISIYLCHRYQFSFRLYVFRYPSFDAINFTSQLGNILKLPYFHEDKFVRAHW